MGISGIFNALSLNKNKEMKRNWIFFLRCWLSVANNVDDVDASSEKNKKKLNQTDSHNELIRQHR